MALRRLSNSSAKLSKRAVFTKKLNTKPKSGGKSAEDGFSKAKRLNDEAQKRRDNMLPFRFRIQVGESAKLILLDEKPFFFYEHHWKGATGKWNMFEPCIKDQASCALCQKLGKEGYYVMMLSCIDTRTYTDRNGKDHKNTKKLLPVKATMIPKFERLFRKNGESFRGMMIELHRDNAKSTNIGDSLELIKIVDEKTLSKFKDRAVPVDYEAGFPLLSEKEMRQKYGGKAPVGSEDTQAEDDSNLDEVDFDDED